MSLFDAPVPGSPITTSGTFRPVLTLQDANTVFSGPTTGDADTPSFRSLQQSDLPGLNGVASFLRDGGQVVWLQNYDYTGSAANYVILGNQYSSPQTNFTLAAAHATLDRIDLIVVTTSSTLTVITGTPSSNPSEPSYDPQTQLPLAFILVTHNTSQPPCASIETVYFDDSGTPGEWAATASSGSINVGSTTNPKSPSTKCIEATLITTDESISLIPLNPVSIASATQFNFYVRSKRPWSGGSLSIQIAMSTGEPTTFIMVQDGSFGFDSRNITTYQQISIPISSFNIPAGLLVGGIKFFITPAAISMGFYLADITIATNCITPVTPPSGATPGIDSVLAVGQALTADRNISLNGNFLSISSGVGNNNGIFLVSALGSEASKIAADNDIGHSLGEFIANINDGYNFDIDATNGTNEVQIYGDAVANSIIYTADLHTFVGANNSILTMLDSGAAQLNQYGSGTFTGTPTSNLSSDASGNVIEVQGASGSFTAQSGEVITVTNGIITDIAPP